MCYQMLKIRLDWYCMINYPIINFQMLKYNSKLELHSVRYWLLYCWLILYSSAKFQVTPGLKKYVLRRQYPMNTLEEMERKVSYIERVQNQRWWKCKKKTCIFDMCQLLKYRRIIDYSIIFAENIELGPFFANYVIDGRCDARICGVHF